MKKLTSILIPLILFLFACEKEAIKIDLRDKYVGHYEGTGHKYANPTYNATVELIKHPNIDNALILQCSYGTSSSTWEQEEYKGNRIYLSDNGFIYQSDMHYWDLYVEKKCYYKEPDSLICIAYFPVYDPNDYHILFYDKFFFKGKKID